MEDLHELVLDVAVLLKALRGARQDAAEVVTQLTDQLQVYRDLDARAAQTLTEAAQRAATTLLQAQTQAAAQLGPLLQQQHAPLLATWQQVVAQATHAQRWLPWQIAVLLLSVTLLVNGGVTFWWQHRQAAERHTLQQAQRLAVGLDRHLLETLYPQLTPAQQRALEAVYTEAQWPALRTRRR